MTTLSIILLVLLAIIITSSFFMIKNLIKKNEILEDFIAKQSEANKACDQRLQQVDNKGIFYADDEIGWFFQEVQKIQEALNEFTLK